MDSVEMTALSGVHKCETSGAVNLGQPWHSKPSSSSDRLHNSLLPAATQFNDLRATLSEATNAEKSILFQGRFDRQNFFLLLSPKHHWWSIKKPIAWVWVKKKYIYICFVFLFCIFHLFTASAVLLQTMAAVLCCAPVPGEQLKMGVMEGSRCWKKLSYKNLI